MKEVWKEVFDNKYYLVSNKGRIRSLFTNKERSPFTTKKGYKRVGLYYYEKGRDEGELDKRGRKRKTLKRYGMEGVQKNKLVHQLVLRTFTKKPEWATMVNHKDGDKKNNSLENLEWSTNSRNMRHAYKNGLNKRRSGGESGNSRLKIEEVREIRKRIKEGDSDTTIGRDYDVTAANIYRIRKGQTWKGWE